MHDWHKASEMLLDGASGGQILRHVLAFAFATDKAAVQVSVNTMCGGRFSNGLFFLQWTTASLKLRQPCASEMRRQGAEPNHEPRFLPPRRDKPFGNLYRARTKAVGFVLALGPSVD